MRFLVEISHECEGDPRCAVKHLQATATWKVLACAAHVHGQDSGVIAVALVDLGSVRSELDNLSCAIAATTTVLNQLVEAREHAG